MNEQPEVPTVSLVKKIPYIVTLVLVLICAGAWYFFKIYTPVKEEEVKQVHVQRPKTEENPGLIDEVLIDSKHVVSEGTYTLVDVTYPQFRNIPTLENERIRTLYESVIKEHVQISEENFKARLSTDPNPEASQKPIAKDDKYQFYGNFTVVQANENFVSVLFVYGGYQGGAHGYENIASFNYDVKNKKRVYLKDMFKPEKDPIGYIARESRVLLLKKLAPEVVYKDLFQDISFTNEIDMNVVEMLYMGTEPETDNFKVYTFTPSGVTFYFGEYQVAPYVYGRQDVFIPYIPSLYPAVPSKNTETIQP